MSPSRRVSSRYADPALAGLVALVVYTLHGFDAGLGRDEGTFVYGGQQVAHGVPPYAGIFNSIGPVVDVVTGIGIRVGWLLGVDDVLAARLTYLAVSVAVVACLSVLSREALRSRVAALLVPAVFLTFASFLKLATAGPRDKTVMLLFLELAVLMLLRRRWFSAGALTALAVLTWQPVLLAAVAAAVAAVWTGGTPRLRAAAAYVVGGAVPTGLVALLFLVSGHLTVAWWGFVVVNVGYTSQPTIVGSWRIVVVDYRGSLVLVVAGWLLAVALGVLALLRLVRRDRSDATDEAVDRNLLVLGAGGLAAGLWSCLAINGGADLFVVLPFAALGIGRTLILAIRSLPTVPRARWVAVVVTLAVAAAAAEAVTTRDHVLPGERVAVTQMAAALPPGARVLSITSPEVLALLGRRNPYPWQLSTEATAPFMDDHLDGGLAGYADRIARLRPALIALGHNSEDTWLRPLLRQHYTRIGGADFWSWYASKRLGPDVLRRLRAVEAAAGTG